jgi:hypothetical protein
MLSPRPSPLAGALPFESEVPSFRSLLMYRRRVLTPPHGTYRHFISSY